MMQSPPPLNYSSPCDDKRPSRFWGVLALIMAAVSLVWIGYVELMQTELFIRLGLLSRDWWDTLYPVAWIPCATGAVVAIIAGTQPANRTCGQIALTIIFLVFWWWSLVPYFWR